MSLDLATATRRAQFGKRMPATPLPIVSGPIQFELPQAPPKRPNTSIPISAKFGSWRVTCEMRPAELLPPAPPSEPRPPRITIERIQHIVAHHYNMTADELCSDRRTADVVRARHIAMYLATTMTKRSISEIGRRFERDHTSVIAAVRKLERWISKNPQFAEEIKSVRETII